MAIELCDCVHRRGKLKLGVVPLLNPHSVICLSAGAEQQDGIFKKITFLKSRRRHNIGYLVILLSVGGQKETIVLFVFVQLDCMETHTHKHARTHAHTQSSLLSYHTFFFCILSQSASLFSRTLDALSRLLLLGQPR